MKMKKKRLFYGAATALITPFSGDTVDKDALMRLVEFQLSEGIETLIFGGTTGEAATLTDKERYSLFYFLRERIEKRARLIYGTTPVLPFCTQERQRQREQTALLS